MTERELLYVKTIVEEHSISKAAQKLYVSQPSLSTCIQKIEKQLGTKLFNRTNNGLVQTFAGERYYKLALDVMKIYRNFEIEMSDINNLKKGRIVLGITVYLATHVLPIILPAFKKQCPNNEGQKIRQISDLILQQAAFEPDVILVTKSFETARRLSSEGVGVSFIPRQYIDIFSNSYEADYYYLDQKYNPYWSLCVKVQQHAYLSKAERLFIRMLGSAFGEKGLME